MVHLPGLKPDIIQILLVGPIKEPSFAGFGKRDIPHCGAGFQPAER
jgi:hypothetical protein